MYTPSHRAAHSHVRHSFGAAPRGTNTGRRDFLKSGVAISTLAASGLWVASPAMARSRPLIHLRLDKSNYALGETARLTISESASFKRRMLVSGPTGAEEWRKVDGGGTYAVFATKVRGSGDVTVRLQDRTSGTIHATETVQLVGEGERAGDAQTAMIWSDAHITGLASSGTAWNRMKAVADGAPLDAANVSDPRNKHQIYLLANALVYKRIGSDTYRQRVVAGCRDSIGTENSSSRNTVLGIARTAGTLPVVASLVNMDQSLTGTRSGYTNTSFASWLGTLPTTAAGGHGLYTSLVRTCDVSATNWGTFALWTRAAIARYLGDATEMDACVARFQRWLGDRTQYRQWTTPKVGDSWQPSYVSLEPSYGTNPSTSSKLANYVGVGVANPVGGPSYDGLIVADLSRDATVYEGNYEGYSRTGINYCWGTMQAIWGTALVLDAAGYDVWNWSGQALRRTLAWMERADESPQRGYAEGHFVNFVARAKYPGAGFKMPANSGRGRNIAFTDWLYP